MTEAKKRDTSELSTKSTLMDILEFEDTVEEFSTLQDTMDKHKGKVRTIERLTNDLHNALGRSNPSLKPSGDIAPSHRHNRTFMEKMMETNEYKDLHSTTNGDEWATAIATDHIIDNFAENMDDDLMEQANEQSEQAEQLTQQMEELESKVNSLQDLLDMNDMTDEQEQDIQQQQAQAQQDLNGAQGQMQALEEAMDTTGKAMGRAVRVAVKKGMKQATEEIAEVEGLGCGWGVGAGDLSKLPTETKIQLAKQMKENHKLRQIAKQLGSLKRIATTKRKKRYGKAREEIYDITLGDDIKYALPSEKALLMNPQTKPIFLKKFMEKSLKCYALRGKEKKGAGAVICEIDVSGSMSGQNEIWSKVIALGLLEIAGKEKRDFACVFFDTQVQKIFRITKDMKPVDRLKVILDIASFFTAGGTSFEEPLNTAREILEEKEFNKADIVVITDGECNVGDAWLKDFLDWRNKNKVTVQGILVGRPVNVLSKFCQQTYSIVDLFSDKQNDEVHSVFTLMS